MGAGGDMGWSSAMDPLGIRPGEKAVLDRWSEGWPLSWQFIDGDKPYARIIYQPDEDAGPSRR